MIGGGNSAGQAAVFLSQNTAGVTMLIRGPSLAATMSRYLIQRIEENPRIQVHYLSEVTDLVGTDRLEQVSWLDRKKRQRHHGGCTTRLHDDRASPKTPWLSNCIALDTRASF